MPRIPEDGEPGGAPRESLFERALREMEKEGLGLAGGPGGGLELDEEAESEAAAERKRRAEAEAAAEELRREQAAATVRNSALSERRERLFFQHGVSSRARLVAEEALRAARDAAGPGGAGLSAQLEGDLDGRFARMMAEVSASLGWAPDQAALELAERVTGAQRASALSAGAALEAQVRLEATEARLGQEVEVLEGLAFRFPGSLESQMGGLDRLQAIARVMELPAAEVEAFGDDAMRRLTLAALRGLVGENPEAALKTLGQGDFGLLGVSAAEVAEVEAAAEAGRDDRAREAARDERVIAAEALRGLELEVAQGRAGPLEVAAAHRDGRITDGQRSALDRQAAQVRARAVKRDEQVSRVADALAGTGPSGKPQDATWRAAVDAYYEDVVAHGQDPAAVAADAAEMARRGLARLVARTGVLPAMLNLRLAAGSLAGRPSVETARQVLDIDRESPGLLDREAANGGPLTVKQLAFSRKVGEGLEAGLDIETAAEYVQAQVAAAAGEDGPVAAGEREPDAESAAIGPIVQWVVRAGAMAI